MSVRTIANTRNAYGRNVSESQIRSTAAAMRGLSAASGRRPEDGANRVRRAEKIGGLVRLIS